MDPWGVMGSEYNRVPIISDDMSRGKKKKGLGVRKDDSVFYTVSNRKKLSLLRYSRPCMCGSLTHRTTRHLSCRLNPRYADACVNNK